MKRLVNYYRSQKLVIVGYDFQSEGGAWRSIYRFFRYAEAQGEATLLIDRRKQGTFRQLLAAFCFSPCILVNGIGVFYCWEGILACFFRTDILIYLHDTAHSVGGFARMHPWKFRFFRFILKRNTVLCVSEQMEKYYRNEFSVRHSQVVREAVALPTQPEFEPGLRHIVMVGSLDERKGVPLFSEVAAMAAAKNLPWKFHWVGALASQSLGKLSQNVHWWGWQDTPLEFVRRAEVFFLSSVDDPLPLACLEAMMLGKRCVVYRQTGIAEMIEGVCGCAIFENYSSADAFRALEKVLGENPDRARLAQITEENASVPAFVAKIQQIIVAKNLR